MKFQFKIQPFQTEAAESVVRVFTGQPNVGGAKYRRDIGSEKNVSEEDRVARRNYAAISYSAQRKPYSAVFRDGSFASDSAMVNFEQVFSTYSPNTIRRVL